MTINLFNGDSVSVPISGSQRSQSAGPSSLALSFGMLTTRVVRLRAAAYNHRLAGRDSFYATRALLGLLQGGFIPDLVLYLVSLLSPPV